MATNSEWTVTPHTSIWGSYATIENVSHFLYPACSTLAIMAQVESVIRILVLSMYRIVSCSMKGDVSELRDTGINKMCWALLARHPSVLGHLHHGLQSVQPLTEHLALVHQGNLLLHGGTDTKELTHFIEGSTKA